MPDAEEFSQGGPANFAQLFTRYLVSETKHNLIGLLFESAVLGPVKCRKIYSFQQCDYYRLRVLKPALKAIAAAKNKLQPETVFKKPIDQIVKLIEAEKPDVIFLNGFGIYNWMLLKAGEITQTPVIIQHAGIWTKELSVHKKFYSAEGRRIMEKMERDSTRIAAREIFLNEWSREEYRQLIAKVDLKKTSVVPLPFDFASFKKLSAENKTQLFNFDKKLFHIGIIARWDEIKNHRAVLSLAKEAKKKNLPWLFHAVTNIPETGGYEKEREKYCRHVDVIPPLERGTISQFCRAVDLLILPSIFDVSPTVVLEAIALNTPIVISPQVGFAREFRIHGAKKWIIDFHDTAAAVNRVENLLGQKMPKLLAREIKLNHGHKKVFAEYIKIFKKTVAKSA